MKIREGFVSNSSSSSFLIYGIYVDGGLADLYNAAHTLPKDSEVEADVDEDEEADYEIGEKLEEAGLSVNTPYDGKFIGLSWDDVNDDETGAQFKKRVEDLICQELGEKFRGKLSSHSEAWMN